MGVSAKIDRPDIHKGALPRGVRNNNPGNIDYNKNNAWQGRLPRNTSVEDRFERFVSPEYGIRALARVLITYQDKHGLATVRDIIGRWAPPTENNSGAYIDRVAQALKTGAMDRVDVHEYWTMKALVVAIIAHENSGYAYPDAVVDAGLALAGVQPPGAVVTVEQKKPLLRETGTWERILQGSGALLTAEGVRSLKENVDAAKSLKESVASVEPSFALYVGFALLVVALVVGVYRIVQKQRSLSKATG